MHLQGCYRKHTESIPAAAVLVAGFVQPKNAFCLLPFFSLGSSNRIHAGFGSCMPINQAQHALSAPSQLAEHSNHTPSGPGPYLPKPRSIYEALESAYWPKRPNILTSDDDGYWKAVRQAAAPCFSMSNMKQVGV